MRLSHAAWARRIRHHIADPRLSCVRGTAAGDRGMAGEAGVKKVRQAPACPCGSGQAYAVCCGTFIDNDVLPATAEQLMRSRYSAYVLAREDYLLRTWHGSTCPAFLGLQAAGPVKWLGPQIPRREG